MPGRIETYVHSDSTTQNKGGALVDLACQTDFAAKTPEFVAFAKKVARMAYAASANTTQVSEVATIRWDDIVNLFPEMETERAALSKEVKEEIVLVNAVVLAVTPHWAIEVEPV